MFRLFRSLSRMLATEGNLIKLLRYTFIELTLVILGILIALQINNWNENRQEKVFEQKMLQELKIALDSDIQILKNVLEIVRERQKSNQILIDVSRKRVPINDTLILHFNTAACEYFFTYNTGPFEAIKSSGLDRISNDTLRNEIIKVYGQQLPQTYLYMNSVARELIWKAQEAYKEYFNIRISPDPSTMYRNRYRPQNPNLIIDEDLHELLYLNQAVIFSYISRVGRRIETMQQLSENLGKVL